MHCGIQHTVVIEILFFIQTVLVHIYFYRGFYRSVALVLLFKLKGDTGYRYKKLGHIISRNMATLADVGWKLLEFKARSKRSGIPLLRMICLRTPFCAVVLACVRACHFVKTT